MDPITPLGLGATPQAATPAAMQGLGGLDGQAFMNLLVTQLRYQDPMAPADTHGLMQQTSMLAQTEMLTQVSQVQQQLLGLQRATVATDLIGSHVEGVTATGGTVSGVVDGVRFATTGPVLVIGDAELPLDDATSIGTATPRGAAGATTQISGGGPVARTDTTWDASSVLVDDVPSSTADTSGRD